MNYKVLSQESHEMTLAWHLSFLGRNIYPDGHSRLRMEESMAHRRIEVLGGFLGGGGGAGGAGRRLDTESAHLGIQ